MGRDLNINGPCLVTVKGGGALAQSSGGEGLILHELGLSIGDIRIIPNFIHRDINCDDFGPDVPPEVMVSLADAMIHMVLIHYDNQVLDWCMSNSLGFYDDGVNDLNAGTMAGAGTILGGGQAIQDSTNLLISLNLSAPGVVTPDNVHTFAPRPWRFPAAYIAANPMEIPLGTTRTAVVIRWRAIPYVTYNSRSSELKSRAAVLWNRTADT